MVYCATKENLYLLLHSREFRNAHKEPQSRIADSNLTEEENEVVIVEESDMRLAGIWHTGDYAMIRRSFEHVMAALSVLEAPLNDMTCVGVYLTDPFSVSVLSTLKSFAGVLITDDTEIPEAMTDHWPVQMRSRVEFAIWSKSKPGIDWLHSGYTEFCENTARFVSHRKPEGYGLICKLKNRL